MFIYDIPSKFFSLIMAIVTLFSPLFVPKTKTAAYKAEIDYVFANEQAYSASGQITINSEEDGVYTVFWGNEKAEKLTEKISGHTITYSELTTVEVKNGEGSENIYEFTAMPENAKTVLAFNGKTLAASAKIPDEKLGKRSEIYRFGALSDVHFNRYYRSLVDDSLSTFPNALSFLDLYDVDFAAISGDLSASSETSAFQKFNRITSRYDFPVYTTTGNHDVTSKLDKQAWLKYVNNGVYSEKKNSGIVEANNDTFDFIYEPPMGKGDIFVFLSQCDWDYNNKPDTPENGETNGESRILTDAQLDWLENTLERYKERRVHLFFHTFFENFGTGDLATGEGNIINDAGATYGLVYTHGTADQIRFASLLKKYKNVIAYNGHSHWAFDMIKFNPLLNVTNYGGETATMVHISSVASPRRLENGSKKTQEYYFKDSEGYLVTVYDNCMILQGINFLKGEKLSYATYIIY
ncbi:MAG: metallophosphoesterase [Clostridiales bacterium]|nr:metallophosphoesterase [Clostridiales bacterium]